MKRFRPLLATLVLAVGVAFAGCGSSGATNTPSGPTTPNATVSPGSTPGSTTPCTIPQHNGGDHDSDNNGGPSDGDGCDT
ncbi:MAG TPA: hypothetical protein VFZ97_17415 [Acidimicrobiales bacterium]